MLKHLLLALVLLLAGATYAQAQTLVSGQITDADGFQWQSGSYAFSSTAIGQSPITGSLSATGSYTSVSIPHTSATAAVGDIWTLKVCPSFNYGCFSATQTITGSTLTLNLTPTAIRFSAITPYQQQPSAYGDAEITNGYQGFEYYNVTLAAWRSCTLVAGGSCTWANSAAASSPTPGTFNSTFDPPLFQNYSLTTTGPQAAINETAAPIDTHILQWRPSGTVSTCTIALDTSPDGVSWTAGGAIAGQTCTSAGEFSASQAITANYVRVNLTTLTGGGTLTVIYSGRIAPSPSSNGAISNGIWVTTGDILWTQVTVPFAATFGVFTNARILQPNGNVVNNTWTVASCVATFTGGWGTGQVMPVSGWLQNVTSQINTGDFPQGSMYLNHYLLNSMPTGGGNSACASTLATSNENALLDGAPTGSVFPVSWPSSGIVGPWTIPGFSKVVTISNPSAGVDFISSTYGASGGIPGRWCVQGVFFKLVTSATVANRTPGINITFGGGTFQMVFAPSTPQTASTTVFYSYAPGATAQTQTLNSGAVYQTVPFSNGQPVCFNAGANGVVQSVTGGIQAGDQLQSIAILFNVQEENN